MKRERRKRLDIPPGWKPKKRKRISLAIPRCPGGHVDFPPSDCQKSKPYCPDPERYEEIRVVDYCICSYICPRQKADHCPRKAEEDAGEKRRISKLKNGGD